MKDLKKAKEKDLLKEVKNLKEKIRTMSFSAGSGVSKDSFARRKTRKEIAKILTELNSRTEDKK
jgi:ribosomal protein L29